ncbi:MAG: hypothetical protein AB8G96_13460 [Phycisphaerales bacterium]
MPLCNSSFIERGRFACLGLIALIIASVFPGAATADEPYYLIARPGVARILRTNLQGQPMGNLVIGEIGVFTPQHFCLGPNNRRLFVPTYRGTRSVLIFDVETGEQLGEITHPDFMAPAWVRMADSGELIISDFDAGRVYLYDINQFAFTGELVEPGHLVTAHAIQFEPDGRMLVVDWWAGAVVQFAADGSHIGDFYRGPALVGPLDIAVTPGGDRLIVSNNSGLDVATFDRATGALLDPFVPLSAGLGAPEAMLGARDGSLLVAYPVQGVVRRFDRATGKFLGNFNTNGGSPVDILLVPASCPTDVTGDEKTAFDDLLTVLSAWGPCENCSIDLDADGAVGMPDVLQVMASWGDCQS